MFTRRSFILAGICVMWRLMYLIAFPMLTDRGRHCARKLQQEISQSTTGSIVITLKWKEYFTHVGFVANHFLSHLSFASSSKIHQGKETNNNRWPLRVTLTLDETFTDVEITWYWVGVWLPSRDWVPSVLEYSSPRWSAKVNLARQHWNKLCIYVAPRSLLFS